VLADPTKHKTSTILHQDREPRSRGIPAITHVNPQRTPFPETHRERLFLCLSHPGSNDPFGCPPAAKDSSRNNLYRFVKSNQPCLTLPSAPIDNVISRRLLSARCGSPCIPTITAAVPGMPMTRTGRGAGQLKITPRVGRPCRLALLESTGPHPSPFSLSAFSTTQSSQMHHILWVRSLIFHTSFSALSRTSCSLRSALLSPNLSNVPTRLVSAAVRQASAPEPSRDNPRAFTHKTWAFLRPRRIATRH
jgi:hypothetical protein